MLCFRAACNLLNLWATIGSLPACLIQRTGVWNSTAVWGMVLVVVRATISGCVVASAGFVEILLRSPGGGAESKLFKNYGPQGAQGAKSSKITVPRGGVHYLQKGTMFVRTFLGSIEGLIPIYAIPICQV